MKERPILFSAPMVRALLAGTKTQTRRIVRLDGRTVDSRADGTRYVARVTRSPQETSFTVPCPYGVAGDRLWVRETFALAPQCHDPMPGNEDDWAPIYRADGDERPWTNADGDDCAPPWKPSIFMPRWASRITLEVIGVRVEQVQDISGDDVIAEGIDPKPHLCGCEVCRMTSRLCPASESSLVHAYSELWADINGAESWLANPFVWVVEFRRVDAATSTLRAMGAG